MSFSIVQSDALEFLRSQANDSVDLCFFSPPYVDCRLYLEGGVDIGVAISDPEEWSRWMVEVFRECRRVCVGLVACVCDGKTSDFCWKPAPHLLGADLYRAGFNLRKTPIFHRVGIPGSGGPDFFRGDCEFILCTSRPGKLPWSDNTACGHVPKFVAGGDPSHRTVDGTRVNGTGSTTRGRGRVKSVTSGRKNGDIQTLDVYTAPALANPGSVLDCRYTATEVAEMIRRESDYHDCIVGGGLMGEQSALASMNEAPFPEELPERYILSFCRPGGVVLDCFGGSFTTGAVAVRHGRRFVGCDVRESQCKLGRSRMANETPLSLFF